MKLQYQLMLLMLLLRLLETSSLFVAFALASSDAVSDMMFSVSVMITRAVEPV